jgi:hypothetical protein
LNLGVVAHTVTFRTGTWYVQHAQEHAITDELLRDSDLARTTGVSGVGLVFLCLVKDWKLCAVSVSSCVCPRAVPPVSRCLLTGPGSPRCLLTGTVHSAPKPLTRFTSVVVCSEPP